MPVTAHNKRHRPIGLMLSLFLIIFALNVRMLSAQQQNLRQPIRVRIFNMQNITAEQAKDYLASTQVGGTVVVIPGTTAVSVTASPEELVFATSILNLVDSNEQFDVKFIDIELDKILPGSDDIGEKLGKEFAIGTLFEGPVSSSSVETVKVIVDKHKDKILIISPSDRIQAVVNAVEQLLTTPKEPDIVPSANDVNIVQEPIIIEANEVPVIFKPDVQIEDELLGEFMTELSEAAKAEAEAKKAAAESVPPPQLVVEEEKTEPLPEPQPEILQAEAQEPAEQEIITARAPTVLDMDIPNGG
ncbi:MAG: hypothetical protein PHQ00_05380, partial [Phycisphaerae bacterium]|nr:hypothetical protein [Phycisphaerae bacterium]